MGNETEALENVDAGNTNDIMGAKQLKTTLTQ